MYDMIIVGSGVSGLGAAIYAKRFGMKMIILGDARGGTITLTHLVENYPGFSSISGLGLAQEFMKHTDSLDIPIEDKKVTEIKKEGDIFKVYVGEELLEAKSVLIATGTEHRKLGAPGEKEFTNRGVSYCATCDGPFYRDKVAAVIGGGDSATKEALLLATYCSKVYLISRKERLTAEPINIDRFKALENTEHLPLAEVKEVLGDKTGVTGIKLSTGKSLDLEGVFIEVGRLPRNELAKSLEVELNGKGEIIIDRYSKTNIDKLYAAGDITDTTFKQAITGVSEGVMAAYTAFKELT